MARPEVTSARAACPDKGKVIYVGEPTQPDESVTSPASPLPSDAPPAAQAVPPEPEDDPETEAGSSADDLRAANLADLEREDNQDPGLFAAGSALPSSREEDDDPFDLKSKGLTIKDLLVAEQPGADKNEVIYANPGYIALAKSGVMAPLTAPKPGEVGHPDTAPLFGVTIWMFDGRVLPLVHRWEDPTRAELFVSELRKLW